MTSNRRAHRSARVPPEVLPMAKKRLNPRAASLAAVEPPEPSSTVQSAQSAMEDAADQLDAQNEELRCAQAELEDSRNRYASLYDWAPVGYLTLDGAGRLLELNLTGAALL